MTWLVENWPLPALVLASYAAVRCMCSMFYERGRADRYRAQLIRHGIAPDEE